MLKNLWKHLINQDDELVGWFICEGLPEEDLSIHYSIVNDLLKETTDFEIKHKFFKVLMLIDTVINSKKVNQAF